MADDVSQAALREPMVTPDVDLSGFPRMPFNVDKLRRSKSWLIARKKPELGFYMINLWMASWLETPPGSLEDDDEVLCDRAMCKDDRWPKVRDQVMRNWVKCSDGRLYHETVAEVVNFVWASKVEHRERTAAATAARKAKRDAAIAGRDDDRHEGRDVERDGQRNDKRDEGRDDERDDSRDVHQGKGKVEEKEKGKKRTPQPPKGGTGLMTFRIWINKLKEGGEKPIPSGHSVFQYAEEVGIPGEFLSLGWEQFKDRYLETDKRYKDWRRVFLKAIKGNWGKLWYFDTEGQCRLTTSGVQAQREHAAKSGKDGRAAT